ncbi:MAG: YdcF family protein, partial [Deltaproteobacteria bacterium]|nr:YdcF family protein [Deltaproteobacteria bacterium]
QDNRPIEPEGKTFNRFSVFKLVLFLIFVAYMLVSAFHVPILTRMGKYLVVEHPLKKSDLIVCLSGSSVERGLEVAELYKKGLAPGIFITRGELPAGYEALQKKGGHYPEERSLVVRLLQGLDVPRSACLSSDRFVSSTFDEAKLLWEITKERGYKSLIVVTSPTHTRRTWLTFQKVFEKGDVVIAVKPSRYSNFRSDGWWKTRQYVREVIFEYQKLIYYALTYFRG